MVRLWEPQMYIAPSESRCALSNLQLKTGLQLVCNQLLLITEVTRLSIDEVIRLLQEIKDLGETGKKTVKQAKKVVKKVKRAPSAYQKRYGAAFRKLASTYKKKNGQWKKDGFKRCAAAARKQAKR